MGKKSIRTELGVLFVGLFNFLGAFQEVYLGNLFQQVDPLLVMVTTFTITALFFLVIEVRNLPKLLSTIKSQWKTVLAVNVSTTLSWVGFFMALKYLEPAVVSAMCFAIGPVLTTLTSKFLRSEVPLLKMEAVAAGGTLIGLGILALTTITGTSSIGAMSSSMAVIGLIFSVLSALGIMGNTFFQKRLSEGGLTARQVMCVRFWLLLVVGMAFGPKFTLHAVGMGTFFMQSLFIAGVTVILPLYILQLGIERLEPITVSLILAAMPIMTFFLQLFDSRLAPSLYTLSGVTLCLGFSVMGTLVRLGATPSTAAEQQPVLEGQ